MSDALAITVERLGKRWNSFRETLSQSVDGASLGVFRICFGLVMCYWALKHLWPTENGNYVQFLYTGPGWNFPYHGLEWIRPLPEPWLTYVFVLLALSGLAVAFGAFYRIAATTLFITFTYIFLIEQSTYNNHYYLMSLLALLMILMPAQQCFSVDRWFAKRNQRPSVKPQAAIPFWPVFLLRAQLFIVYFYGGIAKLNWEWLSGRPMLATGEQVLKFGNQFLPLPGAIEDIHVALFVSWFGLIFDLTIGFLLLSRRTRIFGLVLTLAFHFSNHLLFSIGVFPVLAFTATLIFCDVDWPRQVVRWLKIQAAAAPRIRAVRQPVPQPLAVLVVAWIVIQCLVPLRHHLIEGQPEWTDEGHNFSWRMMLKTKTSLLLQFEVVDDELITTNDAGRPQFNWDRCPDGLTHVVHQPVNSHKITWFNKPELVFVYEPYIGLRAIYNPYSTQAKGSIDDQRSRLRRLWQRLYHREPNIRQTITLAEALDRIESDLHKSAIRSRKQQRQLDDFVKQLAVVRERLAADGTQLHDIANQTDALAALLNCQEASSMLRHLTQTHPFAIQGASDESRTYLVVDDPRIAIDDRYETFAKIHKGRAYMVFVDTMHMPYEGGWSGIPELIVTQENGQPFVGWNPAAELNVTQLKRMGRNAPMIQLYAKHIADRWEHQVGHRPAVHAVGIARLNHRLPQPLLDDSVDLASVKMNWFRHNGWISQLDLEKDPVLKVATEGVQHSSPSLR